MSKEYSNIRLFSQTILRASVCLGFALLVCLTVAPRAHAQTLTVTRSDDRNNPICAAGDCSLREAITAANGAPDVNTIQFSALFDAPQVISLTNGQLTISTSMSIIGKGANLTKVSANGAPRVIQIAAGTSNITISGLTIADGDTGNESEGGGILNLGSGTVNLIDCAFTNNRSTVYGSGLSRGDGGTWNITGCTFSGNNAFQGAIYISGGITNITNTTISGNIARSPYGGGIMNSWGTLNITNSTITANTANGGAVGGVFSGGSTIIRNSIIAGNNGNLDIDGNTVNNNIVSGGYNFIGRTDGSDGFTNGVNNDQVGSPASPKNPLLLPLANNGGKTLTHGFSVGSPVIDKGLSFGSITDQRGFTRPVDLTAYTNAPGGNGADIGAFEEAPPVTFTVTRIDDRNNPTCAVGDCSLREAITATTATFSLDVIQFSALFNSPQTIILTNGQLVISKSMSIIGKGANLTTVSGNNSTRIFSIEQNLANVTISGLTIANGNGSDGNGSGGNGGGLRNRSTGVVNLTNCTFANNSSSGGYGGGLEDHSPGGGALNISGCTFTGNRAIEGGGIKIESNTVNINNTTISGNTASGPYGGGIGSYNGALTITNSTITENTSNGADFYGSAGGVINLSAGTTTVRNSIIAGNTGVNPDVGGSFVSNGYNLIGKSDGSTGFTNGVNNDQVGTSASPKNPYLLALANNGGTTLTHALIGGSPAIDKGSGTGTDQRGLTRPVDLAAYTNAAGGNGADIGAFEAQTAPAGPPDLTVTKTHTGSFIQGDIGKTYSIIVTNSGFLATNAAVSVIDTLPTGLTATAMTGTGWTCTLGTLTCTRSDLLAAAASYPAITLTVNVNANAPASVTNIVSVSGGGEINAGNNQASDPTTVLTSDLTVTKTHIGNFTQGNTGKTYSIIVTNSGFAATNAAVSVIDTLPTGLTATAMTGAGWSCTLGTLTCTRSNVLAAAASYPAITLTVNVNANAPSLVTNIAVVSGGGESNTGNNTASDPTTVATSDLTVAKTHTGSFVQGDIGKTYSIVVTNIGVVATSGTFSVVDTLPTGLTATAITGTGWTCTLGTLTCTRSDVLAAAASYPAITLTVNVDINAPASVTNIARVSGGNEANTANNQASDPTPIGAVQLIVTRSDDRANSTCAVGDCTLREAISAANTSSDLKTIQFSALFNSPQTITLTNGQLAINKSMSITGKGANLTTVSGNNATRIFFIEQNLSNVTISGLTIANGNGSGGNGGALRILSTGTVNLTNCAIMNNSASYGGGLESNGPVGGALNITGCTFSGNTAGEGGAIKIQNKVVNVSNSTISGNTASSPYGGGIGNYEGTLTITNSTITGNTSPGTGGVSRISGSAGSVTVKNSVIAGNTGANPDVGGSFISTGYNFIGKSDGAAGFTNGVNSDQVGTIASPKNPLLLPLTFNGGTTRTHALSTGSPAIDKGSGTGTDQRGLTRPVDLAAYTNAAGGNGADIGAFEAQTAPIASPDLTVTKTHTGSFTQGDTGKTYSITVTNIGSAATSGTVSVVDALPAGLTATAIAGTGWTCTFATLTCTRADALAAGGSYAAITLTVSVASNAGSSVTNTASLTGGGDTNTANNTASDPTTINAAPRYSISGAVAYGIADANQLFPAVSGVNLNQTGTASASAVSDISGNYSLPNLLAGNYTVTPAKTGEVKGINSLDATRIQQHLVGMTTLTANQLIAADTDGSGTVNSLDATRIQQRAVGMQTQNIIGQWKFAPASRQYNALGGNATAQDYQAILVGEVSGNWATAASFAENSGTLEEEILPTTDVETAERFAGNLLTTEIFADDLLGRTEEETKQSSDLSTKESTTETLVPAADIQVSLPANAMRSTGTTVTIPITIGAIPAGQSIESFDFSVFYNPAVLQPAATPGSNTGTLSANCSALPFSPVAGRVSVSGACAQAITTGSGVLYNLTFNVIGAVNQTSGLSFTNPANNTNTFQFNNGTPTVATANGQFTVGLAPTAANVSASGRVLTGDGRGLKNAVVNITDATGATRTTLTGSFGFFRFDNVPAGQTYVFNVSSKNYSFAPQLVMVYEDLTELNFMPVGEAP